MGINDRQADRARPSRETIGERSTKHGNKKRGAASREYCAWTNLKTRCLNPKSKCFTNYGGRGITVCESWRNDFGAFLSDMGACPDGMTIERRDTDGNYEPGNCYWATQKVQQNNRRNNHLVTYNGATHTITEWADLVRISEATLRNRLQRGLDMDRVFANRDLRAGRTFKWKKNRGNA